jgi:ABC-2 type transport system ATP-binding protein
VESVDVRGEAVYIHAKDTDEVARYLLTRTSAHDLEITARGLEDAFLSLTGDADSGDAMTHTFDSPEGDR